MLSQTAANGMYNIPASVLTSCLAVHLLFIVIIKRVIFNSCGTITGLYGAVSKAASVLHAGHAGHAGHARLL